MKVKTYRKLHRITVPIFALFFLIVSISGLILAWKKNSAGFLLPKTEQGISADLISWLPIGLLSKIAVQSLKDSLSENISVEISKIDIRPKNGVAKFIFKHHYHEVQLDCATGKVLSVGKRNADWIEAIHDGSIIDWVFNIKGDPVKVIYSSIIALGALFMTFTGIMIWYNRKKKVIKKTL